MRHLKRTCNKCRLGRPGRQDSYWTYIGQPISFIGMAGRTGIVYMEDGQ